MSTVSSRFLAILVLMSSSAGAMVLDNRYIPLIRYPYVFGDSHYTADLFVVTADRSLGENNTSIGLPEIYGKYDEQEIAKAFVIAGKQNPLPVGLQHVEIPWRIEGKIEGQGIMFAGNQRITDIVSLGFSLFMLSTDSSQVFVFEKMDGFSLGERQQLERDRRQMHQEIGLWSDNVHQFGLGDLVLYARFGKEWDYVLKCKHIQAGFTAGVFIPTGVTTNVHFAPSIPFGGNGHPGVFFALDAEFEVKEDWKCGLLTQLSQRAARTCLMRAPVNKEPDIFGYVVGQFQVSPGITFSAAPYIMFENLRDGLGAWLQYTATSHTQDQWVDMRADKQIPVKLEGVEERSKWGSDYATLTVFYDFGKMKVQREFSPILTFSWDIPGDWWAADRVVRTQKITFGFEFDF